MTAVAGFDLAVMKQGADATRGLVRAGGELLMRIYTHPQPTVAGVTVETPTGHRYRRPTPPVLPGLDLSDPDPPAPDTLIPLEAIEHGPDDVPDPFTTDGPPPF